MTRQEPTGGDGQRFGGVNALRAAAALSVVAFHVNFPAEVTRHSPAHIVIGDLNVGVSLFFVVSGFLLFKPFAAALLREKSASFSRYARNRALRILPLYLCVTSVVWLLDRNQFGFLPLLRGLTFTGVYSIDRPNDVLGVSWSLDDEVVFYLLLPILFIVAERLFPAARRLTGCVTLTIILALISAAYQTFALTALHVSPFGGARDQMLYLNPLSKFQLFACGMLLASIYVREDAAGRRMGRIRRSFMLLTAAALCTLGVGALHKLPMAGDPLIGVGFALLLGTVIFSRPASTVTAVLSWWPFAFLGEISYGIYLWHPFVMGRLGQFGWLSQRFTIAFVETAVVSVVVAAATYLVVERPALSLKDRWIREPIVASPATATRRVPHASVLTAASHVGTLGNDTIAPADGAAPSPLPG